MAFPLKLVEPWKLMLSQQGSSSFMPVQRCITSIFFESRIDLKVCEIPWHGAASPSVGGCVPVPCSDRWEFQCLCCHRDGDGRCCQGAGADLGVLPTQSAFLRRSWVLGIQGWVSLRWLYPEVFEVFILMCKAKYAREEQVCLPPSQRRGRETHNDRRIISS